MQYWWVNHRRSQGQVLAGEFLWSPHIRQTGAANQSYINMAQVRAGDLLLWHADSAVRAVGVALRGGAATLIPTASPAGRRLPVRFMQLDLPLSPKAHMSALGPLLPAKHSPLRASGACNSAVYLASISAPMASELRILLAGQIEDIEARINDTVDSDLAADWVEQIIQQRTDLEAADKLQLIRARRGQGVFRRRLEQLESACRLSGVLDRRHLRARHIKPWSASDDREKLDGFNGLLFSPHVDHLFARGYIAFADDGALLVSRHLNPSVLRSWQIVPPINVGAFSVQQRPYLDYHRHEVFEQPENGRRASSTERSR
jgi:putative restriction endonuclease